MILLLEMGNKKATTKLRMMTFINNNPLFETNYPVLLVQNTHWLQLPSSYRTKLQCSPQAPTGIMLDFEGNTQVSRCSFSNWSLVTDKRPNHQFYWEQLQKPKRLIMRLCCRDFDEVTADCPCRKPAKCAQLPNNYATTKQHLQGWKPQTRWRFLNVVWDS